MRNTLLSLIPTLLLAQSAFAGDNHQHISGGPSQMILITLIMLVFYFVVIRPGNKNKTSVNVNDIKIGDKVIINNSIKGKVVTLHSDGSSVAIEIAQNVKINVLKSSITSINPDATSTDNKNSNSDSKNKHTPEQNKNANSENDKNSMNTSRNKRRMPQRKTYRNNKSDESNTAAKNQDKSSDDKQ